MPQLTSIYTKRHRVRIKDFKQKNIKYSKNNKKCAYTNLIQGRILWLSEFVEFCGRDALAKC